MSTPNNNKGKEKRKQANPYPLRMPDELDRVVRQLAEESRRSINSQVIVMLEEYLKMIARET